MKAKDWLFVGIGAALGILLARQFGASWPFGILAAAIAGAFGYFHENPREQWRKLKLAAKASKGELGFLEAIREQFKARKNWGMFIAATVAPLTSFACWSLINAWFMLGSPPLGLLEAISFLYTLIAAVLIMATWILAENVGLKLKDRTKSVSDMIALLGALVFPICSVLIAFVFVGLMIWYIAFFFAPDVWRFVCKTMRRFFSFIHTEKRAFKAICAAIGATVGWFFADRNALIGAIVGIAVGLVLTWIAACFSKEQASIV